MAIELSDFQAGIQSVVDAVNAIGVKLDTVTANQQTINTAIATANASLGRIETLAETTNTRLNTIISASSTAQTSFNELSAKLTSINANIITNTSAVSNVYSAINTMNTNLGGKIDSTNTSLSKLDSDLLSEAAAIRDSIATSTTDIEDAVFNHINNLISLPFTQMFETEWKPFAEKLLKALGEDGDGATDITGLSKQLNTAFKGLNTLLAREIKLMIEHNHYGNSIEVEELKAEVDTILNESLN